MKTLFWFVVAALSLSVSSARSDSPQQNYYVGDYTIRSDSQQPNYYTGDYVIRSFGPQSLCMIVDGKKGCVNYMPDGITYTGELPFDQAAKQLFDYLGYLRCLKEKQ